MRRLAALAFSATLLAAAAGPAKSAPPSPAAPSSRLDEIVSRGVLRVGSTGDYKPFSYRPGAGADFVGLDIDLAADLARSLGVKLDVVPTSWPTLMKDYADDRFDLAIGGISVTLDRQKKALFSLPYLRDGKTPITRCADQARFQTLAQIDRPDVRLIENPGGTNERFARAHAPHAQLTIYPDNVTIFDQIAEGRADVMITDATETRLQQRLHPGLCAVHPDAPFDFSEKAVLLPRDLVFKAYVDQWLHQAEASGALARQVEHWLAYPWGLYTLEQLMEQRLAIGRDVARAKWNSHAPIEDLPREAQIIGQLTAQAVKAGVPAPLAQRFFKAQIEASKTVQRHLFEQWTNAKQGPFADAPDVARDLRPKLDALTPRLLHALAQNLPVLQDASRAGEVSQALSPLLSSAVVNDREAAQQALMPLVPLLPQTAEPPLKALRAARIYPAPDAAPIDDGVVLVRGDRIVGVAPRSAQTDSLPSLAPACDGGVVTAGFQNSHVHLLGSGFANAQTAPAAALQAALTKLLTQYGYTTAFDIASDRDNTLALRERVNRGEIAGPCT